MLRQLTVEKHFSAESLARRLEVDPDTIWKWVRQGRLKKRVMSRKCTRFSASAVNKFLKECEV